MPGPAVDTRLGDAPATIPAMPEPSAQLTAGAPASAPLSSAPAAESVPAQTQPAAPNPPVVVSPAPAAANPEPATTRAMAPADEWPADCEEHYRFTAHGRDGGSSPRFSVPSGSEQVMSFYYKQPWPAARQLLKSRFTFDNTKVIHHWALFATSAQVAPGTIADGDNLFDAVNLIDAQFFVGGGSNGSELELPPDVGLRVPQHSNPGFWLQVHYVNTTDSDQEDASGVELCLTSKPRLHEAAAHTLGKSSFQLPAKTETTITSTCKPRSLSQPVHIVAVTPHMHARGKRVLLSLNRNGAASEPVFDQPFDVHEQRNYVVPSFGLPSEIVVSPGDTLTHSCDYINTTDAIIQSGSKSAQEMWVTLVWAWPADELNNGLNVSPELGVGPGEDCTER